MSEWAKRFGDEWVMECGPDSEWDVRELVDATRKAVLREVRGAIEEDIEHGKKLWPGDECAQRSNACSRMLGRFGKGGQFEIKEE